MAVTRNTFRDREVKGIKKILCHAAEEIYDLLSDGEAVDFKMVSSNSGAFLMLKRQDTKELSMTIRDAESLEIFSFLVLEEKALDAINSFIEGKSKIKPLY